MAEKPPGVGDAPEFPDVVFPIIACPATIAVRFRLKNADERATAKRAIEAAAKLLADSGATVEIKFDQPVQEAP